MANGFINHPTRPNASPLANLADDVVNGGVVSVVEQAQTSDRMGVRVEEGFFLQCTLWVRLDECDSKGDRHLQPFQCHELSLDQELLKAFGRHELILWIV